MKLPNSKRQPKPIIVNFYTNINLEINIVDSRFTTIVYDKRTGSISTYLSSLTWIAIYLANQLTEFTFPN